MAPDEIVDDGTLDCASVPRIVSLVLDVLSCMSLSLDQSSRFARKVGIWVTDCLSLKSSDRVVSSTYLWTVQPVYKSSVSTRKERGPSQESCGMAPLKVFQDEIGLDVLARTRFCRSRLVR